MARIPAPVVVVVVVVAFFFFSFTLSHARIPANAPRDEVTKVEVPSSLSESAEVNPIIRLPSYSDEDSQFHSTGKPVNEISKAPETSNPAQSVPLNVVTFRPVNHPFRFRSRFPSRCRHHRHHHHRFFMPITTSQQQQQHREIPYGDDMIIVSGENAYSDQAILHGHGRVRRVWPRLVRVHHHHHHGGQKLDGDAFPQLMFRPSIALDEDKLEMYKQQLQQLQQHQHHHYRIHENDVEEETKEKENHQHQHHHYRIHENDVEEERKEKENHGGFMKRIRKILDHF